MHAGFCTRAWPVGLESRARRRPQGSLPARFLEPRLGLRALPCMKVLRVGFIEPMLALAATKLPVGPAWSYELKFDGYRAIAVRANGRVRLLSRNGKDFTKRFASIARALEALPDDTVIDGEIVAYSDDGRPSFNVLQNHRGAGPELHLYAFDLLTLRGTDLTREPLEERREILRAEVMPLLP